MLLCVCLLIGLSLAQLPGTLQQEVHPSLTYETCTKNGGCQQVQSSIVLDSNWRWTHLNSQAINCYTGNEWNSMRLKEEKEWSRRIVFSLISFILSRIVVDRSLMLPFLTR
jgi:hypothetical protein